MTKRIPEGYEAVIPALGIKGAAEAMEFYKRVFGATEIARMADPEGNIAHAELQIGAGKIMLAEESPEWGNHSPPTLGGTPVRLHLYVEDVDDLVKRAVENGAKIVIPVEDQFYGDRSGRIEDPYGHLWIVSTRIEDLSLEEIERRAAALFGGEGGDQS
jgi:PhnB protein